ncbi:Endonuclease 4 [Novipirellula galeiformis]|uniref:Probable endonuclease 4 n=1 Tax=Novipirellula galeiformis TaxID=2528004 RepID=A0A5C6CC60_9BACT|nr:deoxyribonuclease IV [Novipirellula galeiformis]TWU21024.1 Endonuclease 4 [Novipirellula galeiformis]
MTQKKTTHLFGSHVSVAGGLVKGVGRAVAVGCDVIQIFTKNNNQWAAKPLVPADVAAWKSALAESGIRHPIAHASYLINMATPKDELFQKSIDSLVMELERGNELELEGLVVHPGAFTTSSEADGIKRIIDAVTETLARVEAGSCRLLLENTAGQGSCLGHQIDQLGAMIDGVGDATRVGVCLDTCHAFAAGYAINTTPGFAELRKQIDDLLPPGCISALHLNDSKKPLGSRVDRHEHIGRGEIGLEGFRNVFGDELLGVIPGYLETEKGTDEETGEDWDVINLRVLRELVAEIA